MIKALYDRVEQDELLSPFLPDRFTRTTVVVSPRSGAMFSVGPVQYTEDLGGYEKVLGMTYCALRKGSSL
jgi:hypothetical protein